MDLVIIEPNPFTVFAGPNGAGKSNIFEAIAFWNALEKQKNERSAIQDLIELFGGLTHIRPKNGATNTFNFTISDSRFERIDILDSEKLSKNSRIKDKNQLYLAAIGKHANNRLNVLFNQKMPENRFSQITSSFSRVFINNSKAKKYNNNSPARINEDASNLENVLNRLFENKSTKDKILEWMELFVPGLEDIRIEAPSLSASNEILFKEKGLDSLLPKTLISDGTYNILCLLAAVYQSDEPQFLCIEEPENGLNPYVVRSLVDFFRAECMEKGHYVWLNTHSETLVKELQPQELILVDKVNGETKVKQFKKDFDLHDLTMNEAWLSNALGGGIPW